MLYRIRRIIRPNITGDVHKATALLARKALGRLDRGHSSAQVRAWVQQPRQWDRYGPLATLSILAVLATPKRAEGQTQPHTCSLHTDVEAMACGDCALINARYLATYLPDVRPDRAHYTVADVEAMALAEDVAA